MATIDSIREAGLVTLDQDHEKSNPAEALDLLGSFALNTIKFIGNGIKSFLNFGIGDAPTYEMSSFDEERAKRQAQIDKEFGQRGANRIKNAHVQMRPIDPHHITPSIAKRFGLPAFETQGSCVTLTERVVNKFYTYYPADMRKWSRDAIHQLKNVAPIPVGDFVFDRIKGKIIPAK